ncbi:MAG TPA: phosphohistidine phosphatase SixA [Aggregatilineales bacterium]|nr:phosphohistidine phosphatase SixA [Aggregatilineales bacterium]
MELYFLRHGEAEDYNNDDHNRALTTTGKARLQTAAQVMKRLNLHITKIYTSPRIRALQTAQIAGRELGLEPHITDNLNYGFNQTALAELLAPHSDDAHIMLVGHEPTFSETIAKLTGGNVDMKRGGLVRVDVPKAHLKSGILVWVIAPKVFEALGG